MNNFQINSALVPISTDDPSAAALRQAVAAVLEDQTDLLATVAPAEWARTSGWRGPRLRSLRMVRGVEA